MVMQDERTVRETADELGIDPWMLARLCRYLGIDAVETRIPVVEVDHFKMGATEESRYAAVRGWLIHNARRHSE